MFTTYLLKSLKNNKSYVGVTEKDPKIRLEEHNSGTNTWTRNNGPFKLVYYESYHCRIDAYGREKFLKTGIGNKLVKIILEHF